MKPLAKYIDHTILKADCHAEQIIKLCREADEYQFASVCIPPNFVGLAAEQLKESTVFVCTVIGFPLGYATTATKVFETEDAIANGADEIDMVIAIDKVKDEQWEYVENDITQVYKTCQQNGKLLKVIVETALLTEAEKRKVYDICSQINVDFVKTSTGFSTAGASVKDVELMKECIKPNMQVKASGGIRNGEFARELIKAGATRLGCSSSIKVINS